MRTRILLAVAIVTGTAWTEEGRDVPCAIRHASAIARDAPCLILQCWGPHHLQTLELVFGRGEDRLEIWQVKHHQMPTRLDEAWPEERERRDSWGHALHYLRLNDSSAIAWSYGRDGRPGSICGLFEDQDFFWGLGNSQELARVASHPLGHNGMFLNKDVVLADVGGAARSTNRATD